MHITLKNKQSIIVSSLNSNPGANLVGLLLIQHFKDFRYELLDVSSLLTLVWVHCDSFRE